MRCRCRVYDEGNRSPDLGDQGDIRSEIRLEEHGVQHAADQSGLGESEREVGIFETDYSLAAGLEFEPQIAPGDINGRANLLKLERIGGKFAVEHADLSRTAGPGSYRQGEGVYQPGRVKFEIDNAAQRDIAAELRSENLSAGKDALDPKGRKREGERLDPQPDYATRTGPHLELDVPARHGDIRTVLLEGEPLCRKFKTANFQHRAAGDHPHEVARLNVESNRRTSDIDGQLDRVAGCCLVQFDRKAAGQADIRTALDGNRCAGEAGDPVGLEDEESLPVGDGQQFGGPGLDRQADVGQCDGDYFMAFRCRSLLEGEIADERLSGNRQAHLRTINSEVRSDGQLQTNGVGSESNFPIDRGACGVDRYSKLTGRQRHVVARVQSHRRAGPPGQSVSGQYKHAVGAGYVHEARSPVAEMYIHTGESDCKGAARDLEGELAVQRLSGDLQVHVSSGDAEERSGRNVNRSVDYRLRAGVYRQGNVRIQTDARGRIDRDGSARLAGKTGRGQEESPVGVGNVHQAPAQRHVDVLEFDAQHVLAADGGLAESEITAQRLTGDLQFQTDTLDDGDIRGVIEGDHDRFCAAVGGGKGDCLADRLAGVVESHPDQTAEADARDAEQLDPAFGEQRERV